MDRVLVNDAWLANYPLSHYSVDVPLCSDDSPLMLKNGESQHNASQF